MTTVLNHTDWEAAVDYLNYNLSEYGVSDSEIRSFCKSLDANDYMSEMQWDWQLLLGEAQSHFCDTLEENGYWDEH